MSMNCMNEQITAYSFVPPLSGIVYQTVLVAFFTTAKTHKALLRFTDQ